MKKSKRHVGFTLIELLIVIAIIGILSGSLVLTMSGSTDSAEAARIVADLESLRLAAATYYADNVGGTMTVEIDSLKSYVTAPDKLDGGYSFKTATVDDEEQWFVGYSLSSAGSGVKAALAKSAESNGLRSEAGDTVYTADDTEVYLRVR